MLPITPACSSSASAPTTANAISVSGDRPAKNSASRLEMGGEAAPASAGSASIAANNFCSAREDGAPRLSSSRMVSAHSSWMASYWRAEVRIRSQCLVDAAGVSGAQRTGGGPRPQRLDLTGLRVLGLIPDCHHGQPCSILPALSR